jgi:hypothetical protein
VPGIVRSLDCVAVAAGNALDSVASFRWSLGYDQPVGTASVVCAGHVGGGTFGDDLSIVVDGDSRWSGIIYEIDYGFYPSTTTFVGRGRLQAAADYKLPGFYSREQKGLLLQDLLGSSSGSDTAIVSAVLDRVGLSGSISGTGTTLGTIAPESFVWAASDTALGYIQKIDSISVGYRTFESAGGSIFRTLTSSIPGSPSTTFTEGVDIVDGSSTLTVQGAYSAVRVAGYSVGDYADPRVFLAEGSVLTGYESTYSLESEMIERRANASPGSGMSCEAVANYWLGELNRVIVKVQLKTPRSDVFGPGQSHHISSGDRLGIDDTMWLQRVEGELTSAGTFSQTLTYIGGGA